MKDLKEILNKIEELGGKTYLVGGYVRDKFLNIPSKDIDVEVFGLSYDELSKILSQFGKVDLVGKSFGVLKVNINGEDYDFNLPRRDSKNGISHKDFSIQVDHMMGIEEAASRRDFTINSMSIDIDGNLVDPFNGQKDIKYKILRPTSEAFSEDPLRMLRSIQFSARFGMKPSAKLMRIGYNLLDQYDTIPKERVWEEWKKFALKGVDYTSGLKTLFYTNWIRLYPEIDNLVNVEQDVQWHPEGDVLTHTGFVLDHMHEVCVRENITGDNRLVLIFAALCHDFGKAHTTARRFSEKYGREVISSLGHESAGGPLARSFLESIGCPEGIIEKVVLLVQNHMLCEILSDRAIRRLAVRLGKATIQELVYLIEADQCGRPPLPKKISEKVLHLSYRAIKMGVLNGKQAPLIKGQDIVDFGFKPGPLIGKIQKQLYSLQINGKFACKESGLKMIKSFVKQL